LRNPGVFVKELPVGQDHGQLATMEYAALRTAVLVLYASPVHQGCKITLMYADRG